LTHLPNVSGPLWLKDGRSLITKNGAGAGDVLTVWDLQSGQVRQSLRGMAANLTVWSPDGQTIAASDGKTITLWDVGSGNPRLLLGEIQDGPLAGGSNAEGIFRMAFNPDGTLLAAESGNKRSRIRVWDTRTGQLFGKIWSGKPLEKLSWRSATQLAVWVSSAGVEIWEPASGASQPWFDSALHHAQLDLSADGALAAVHQENRLEIRKLPDGEILHTWEVGMKSLGLVWSPDASKIALFDAEKITIYAVSTGAELGSLKNNLSGLSALQWSPDSASLAYLIWLPGGTPGCPISGTGALYLWPIAAAGSTRVSTEMPMPGLNPAGNIAFSPDGKRLALALGQRGLIVIRP
jgi:WD40 repeat protein